ncbi:hypothetical protein QE152_g35188 [Popillia japonica]|uniref:V(D)J recombination-activating protein 1 RNase H domain-containing protein n=1 Tax=Popillia japonica TaxID=7064 RepID=A0AAW1IGB1_POPJA
MKDENLPNFNAKVNYLESHLLLNYGKTGEDIKNLKQRFALFKVVLKEKWEKSHRKEEAFLKNNESWLNGTFQLPIKSLNRPGRPSKCFHESSERSKRRKTEEIRSTVGDDVIVHAAQTTLSVQGQRYASKILKEITNCPSRAHEYRKAVDKKGNKESAAPLTPLQALTMFVEADLTRRQYEIIRNTNKTFYPPYYLLLEAKQKCYPPKECLRVTDTCAESCLQSLIDNTVTRLSIFLEEVLLTLSEEDRNSLYIICKWGCDGSQQAQYKQKFDSDGKSDANLFLSSFVPLRIVCGKNNKKVIWHNPTPSSPRFCRPIRFQFVKESTDVTKEEIRYIRESVNALKPTEINLNQIKFSFKHSFEMTMVDGKVCNAATGTKSTSQCYICGATQKDFNNITDKEETSNLTGVTFGLSVLHARIRLFESVLHLAYKLPLKKYRKRKTHEEKQLEEKTKKHIQERFRIETGLLVDMPKTNFGNTNDGNTSRRFFENPHLAADITGINYELIYRLKVILETISSGHKIDSQKYDCYAKETAKLYVSLYGWHPMTPTMHKILTHGATIIENALLPIGQLSEEAAEARNKHFRVYRENFARKFSREQCNLDVYHRLLLSSDPLISSLRPKKTSIPKTFCPETINMLMPADSNNNEPDSDDEQQDESITE